MKSRSEAAAYLISEGIKARENPFEGVTKNNSAPESTHNKPSKYERLPKGQCIPQKDYEFPILETLYELGGSGRSSEVLERVRQRLEQRLQDFDYEPVGNGKEVRWHNLASWARKALVKRGLLKNDSNRGIWELTDLGKAEVTGEEIWCF